MQNGPFTIEKLGLRAGQPTQTMVQTRVRVLGRFSLELGQITASSLPTQKARALLAYLVAHRQSDVARERLLDLLWSDATPDVAKNGLRSALWSIRRSIKDAGFDPDDYLIANRAIVRWKAHSWLDAEAFLELAESDDPLDLEAAVELYKGDFVEGDYEEWTVSERARLSDAYDALLARLVTGPRSREAAHLLLNRNPYHEPSYLLLVEEELSAGRIVAAAALAERCERALTEVGAQPSEQLRRLVRGIPSQPIQSAPKLLLPFVGREAELAKVRDHLMNGAAGGRALLISGEAGIGKSAFLSRVADLAESLGYSIVHVRCFDTDSRPFGPFEELYADLNNEPFDPLASSDPADAGERLGKSLFDSLDATALISIDDAHSLAADACRVLSHLAARVSASGRVLMLATRSEGVARLNAAMNGCPSETIPLGRLNSDELNAAIDSVVINDATAVASAIFERSAGHPFFAATLLDSLAQSGVLRSERGLWKLAGELDDRVPLPKTLTTYIRARLRARGDTALQVAGALSLEPTATAENISAAMQLDENQVLNALDDLLLLGVLIQRESAAQFAFAHDLYREVAAATLNPGRRTRLHRAFAQSFALASAAESSLRCARHLSLAGDGLGAAQGYYRAAIEALEWRAPAEARDRCNAGIAALENLERKLEVDAILARLKVLSVKVQAALGDSRSAIAEAAEAIGIANQIADPATALDAAQARQSILNDNFALDAALASAREIAAMARDSQESVPLAIALANESWAERLLGHQIEALQAAREAETTASKARDCEGVCYALEQLILAYITWWKFEDAEKAAARALDIMPQAGRLAQCALRCCIASLNLALERCPKTESEISAAILLLQEHDADSRRTLLHSPFERSRVALALNATSAAAALAQNQTDRAVAMSDALERTPSARARLLADLFRADAQFARGLSNRPAAPEFLRSTPGAFVQDVHSGSRSPELAETLNAVVIGASDAPERLLQALNRIEADARRAPLDADRAFTQLADAAERCNVPHVAERARLRSRDYRNARAMAGSRL